MRLKSNKSQKDWGKRYLIGVLVVLVVYLALLLYYIYPHWPIDLLGWFILILVGIPISLCLEWIGESIFSKEVGQKISDRKLSAKRIIFSLLVFVGIAGVFVILWFIFGSFIRPHFA